MSYTAETINALANFSTAIDKVTGASAYRAERAEIRKEERTMANSMASMAIQSITKMPMQDQINFEQSGFLGYGMDSLGGAIDMPFQQSLAQKRYGQFVDSFEANTLPLLQDLTGTRAMLNYYSPDNRMVKVIDQQINTEVNKFKKTVVDYMDRSPRFSKVATEQGGLLPGMAFQAKSDWHQTKMLADSVDNLLNTLTIDPHGK
jgi:hypothetical protein